MDLKKIIFNTENRFKTIESRKGEFFKNRFKGVGKSALRGGIIGALTVYLLGGDESMILNGVYFFGLIDICQDGVRATNLAGLYNSNKEKYFGLKERYQNLGIVNK